jgi:plastocyanin
VSVRTPRIALLLVAGALAGPACAARYTVTIEGFAFNPPAVTVSAGDTVQWVNKDIVPHSATASDAAFDSKPIPAGGTWEWKAVRRGRHAYICTLHPNMTGAIEVK